MMVALRPTILAKEIRGRDDFHETDEPAPEMPAAA